VRWVQAGLHAVTFLGVAQGKLGTGRVLRAARSRGTEGKRNARGE